MDKRTADALRGLPRAVRAEVERLARDQGRDDASTIARGTLSPEHADRLGDSTDSPFQPRPDPARQVRRETAAERGARSLRDHPLAEREGVGLAALTAATPFGEPFPIQVEGVGVVVAWPRYTDEHVRREEWNRAEHDGCAARLVEDATRFYALWRARDRAPDAASANDLRRAAAAIGTGLRRILDLPPERGPGSGAAWGTLHLTLTLDGKPVRGWLGRSRPRIVDLDAPAFLDVLRGDHGGPKRAALTLVASVLGRSRKAVEQAAGRHRSAFRTGRAENGEDSDPTE